MRGEPNEHPTYRSEASRDLKRCLLIFSDRILCSSVDLGMPRLAVAPCGPHIRPPHSRNAASMISFSPEKEAFLRRSSPRLVAVTAGCHESQLSSMEKVSVSPHNDRAVNHVLEFTNVTGPWVGLSTSNPGDTTLRVKRFYRQNSSGSRYGGLQARYDCSELLTGRCIAYRSVQR